MNYTMNRIINITVNQANKKFTSSYCLNSIPKYGTVRPALLSQSFRFQNTSSGSDDKDKVHQQQSIISNEFKPRRRVPLTYHPPASRRPKPIKRQEPSLDDHDGITILGGSSSSKEKNNDDNDDEKMWLPDESYTKVAKVDDVYKDDPLSQQFNPYVSDIIKQVERTKQRGNHVISSPSVDSQMRLADWVTAEPGSTEDSVMTRRAFAEGTWDEKEREELETNLNEMVEKNREEQFDLPSMEYTNDNSEDDTEEKNDQEEDERSLVAGAPWRDMIVDVSRVQKVTRSGTIVSYRALVVGGNTRGVAGFGIGKGAEPDVASASAKRMCHRNIFFLSAYQGSGLTHDLAGKHNSCKVVIRAVSQGYGLSGNNLIQDILLAFGITNATAKAYGRRNIYSVVYATFKAIKTHKSLESVSLSRGKKFLSLDRARRLQLK